MNWVDLVIIVFVVYFLLVGYYQGFLKQFVDLFGLVLSFAFAVYFYSNVASVINSFFSIPKPFLNAAGFMVAWILFAVLYFIVSNFFYRSVPVWIKNSKANHIAGVIPGFLRGVVIAAIILTLLLIVPIRVNKDIAGSAIAGKLVEQTTSANGYLEDVFGGALNDTLAFLTVKPKSDETVNLEFKTTQVEVDEEAENQMLEMINREREIGGLKPLVKDAALTEVARSHSKDMFANGYFSHTSQDGRSPFDRMKDAGIIFLVAGENLAWAPNVDIAHNGLMNSPGHRANILNSEFGKVGIGVIDGGKYNKMFSQEFTE